MLRKEKLKQKIKTKVSTRKCFNRYKKIVNQILNASTIDDQILSILKKLFSKGKKFITKEEVTKIEEYGKEILESLNLEHLLKVLDLNEKNKESLGEDYFYSFETFISILKYFVLN